MSKRNNLFPFFVFMGLIVLDQLVKFLVIKFFPGLASYNNGIGFGLFVNGNLFILYLIFLASFIYFFPRPSLSVVVLLAAGTSNFLDRILYGGVVDYINLGFWPSFNLADSLIVASALFTIYLQIKKTS